jgi:hypothetical protein
VGLLGVLAFAGCDESLPIDRVAVGTPVSSIVATVAGEATTTIGKIDRFPGGTAVVTSEHTLVGISCDVGTMTMTTSVGVFSGAMDCGAMPPVETIERFVGKAIAITISESRLKIENPEAGSLELPASGVVER